jgi:periplasmic protein TonB
MSTSKFCIQQRQREQQQLKKLLVSSFMGSTLLHGIIAYALPHWSLESPKQAQEPMELILVNKPKPKPKPKPKVESKPIVKPEPKPVPKPEPVKAKTPPPPVKLPEPVEAEIPPPPKPKPVVKPTPQKFLTTPTTAPAQPVVPAPAPEPLKPPKTQPSKLVTPAESNTDRPDVSGSATATNSAPPLPEASDESEEEGISCVSNCEPEYPSELEGVEGAAGVKLTIDPDGNVVAAELADADDHSQINREALLAARQMQFSSPPGGNVASVQVKIDFTVEGSEYDRLAREAQEKQEQAQKERQEKAAAEKQAEQERLNREREAKALQEQQPQPQQPSILNTPTKSKPLPAPLETEVNDEQLREFRERMEKYRED